MNLFWNVSVPYRIAWILAVLFLFSPLLVQAVPTIKVQLRYDQRTDILRLNRSAAPPVQVDESSNFPLQTYNYQTRSQRGPYRVKIFDDQGKEFSQFDFSPQEGTFTLEIPRFSIADSFTIIEKESGQIVIREQIEGGSLCNTNDVCEFERGETVQTCFVDCAQGEVSYSEATTKQLQENNGVIRNEEGTVLLAEGDADSNTQSTEEPENGDGTNIWLLIGGVILLIVAIGTWIYITFIRNKE